MTRREWDALPESVRRAVEDRCGPVVKAEAPEMGVSSEVTATLHLERGAVFCKGIPVDAPGAWQHCNEAAVNQLLPAGLAPRMLWEVTVDGWLLLGFEHVDGRHADLSPYSPDLTPIAETVARLRPALTPCPLPARSISARWARLPAWRNYSEDRPADLDPWEAEHLPRLVELEAAAPELLDGDTLLHTDLQAGNILIGGDGVRLIDWAWASRGAAFIDAAFMVIRLIGAGHTPRTAESWACQVPAWRAARAEAVTAFAASVLGLWEHKTRTAPMPHSAGLTAVARQWARHRLT